MSALVALAQLVVPAASAPLQRAAPPAAPSAKYWVFLRDKHGVAFEPTSYFTPQALARRQRQGLPVADSSDFPVREDYLRQVRSTADSVTGVTRWFNAVACWATPQQVARLRKLPGVRAVHLMPAAPLRPAGKRVSTEADDQLSASELQLAQRQTRTLGGEVLRRAGLDGRGLRVAVLDVGFSGADKHPALAHLLAQKQIVESYDFVRRRPNAFAGGSHGTQVLTCLAGRLPGGPELGLATGAQYLLARTERLTRELYSEEEAWLAAAEWADRLGADIINTSLGYTDNRYFPEQMNGRVSLVARAATQAVRKGMLVVCAAGNDGDDPRWRIVGTPADADSVLSVGGLDPDTWLAVDFSSRGPAAGGRRKPNVTAFGVVMAAGTGGRYARVEGTSFASPLVAGLAACVWQQQRQLKALELFRLLEHSATLYPYFDYAHGFGLPQANHCLQPPPPAPPTLDVVLTADGARVTLRPAATMALHPLPLYADSAMTTQPLQTTEGAPGLLARPSRDKTPAGRLSTETSGQPIQLPYPAYCYWHLADARGRLRRYQALEVAQRAILELPRSSWTPGDVLRVHYRGYTAEQVLP